MSDVCEIRGEESTIAKDNPWANSAESKQRQAESVPLHASCLAMLVPKVSHLFLLKNPAKLPARPFERISIFFTYISQTGIANSLRVGGTYPNVLITILLQVICKSIVAVC